MKLQIDTINKTIKFEGDVVISELIETLKKMFPKDEWKEFLLNAETKIINWTQPTYIPTYPSYPYPWITYYGNISNQAALENYSLTALFQYRKLF
jgi:hypothetical protein